MKAILITSDGETFKTRDLNGIFRIDQLQRFLNEALDFLYVEEPSRIINKHHIVEAYLEEEGKEDA